VLGDLHIPFRTNALPQKFKQLLVRGTYSTQTPQRARLDLIGTKKKKKKKKKVPGKIQKVLCTGNLCSKETLDYLKSLANDVVCTRGEFDEGPFPETKVVQIGQFKVGLIHGHQVSTPPSSSASSQILLTTTL